MVHRDPDTGKFVADHDDRGAVDLDATEVFTGKLLWQIPAADVTAGSDTQELSGEAAQILDFTDYLGSDEVFVTHAVNMEVQLSAGQTATAEHVIETDYHLRSQGNVEEVIGVTPQEEEGIVDVANVDADDDDIIFNGFVAGGGDFADSATGLAGGGNLNHVSHDMNYVDADLPGPAFDQDDELYVPQQILVTGSDDQSARGIFTVTVYGATYDL